MISTLSTHKDETESLYLEICRYDLGAIKYDWEPKAIENLKNILIKTGAVIVISSSWRMFSSLEKLKCMFKIYGLDSYIKGFTPMDHLGRRKYEIDQFILEHPEIEKYVIFDDLNLSEEIVNNFILIKGYLKEEDCNLALKILN